MACFAESVLVVLLWSVLNMRAFTTIYSSVLFCAMICICLHWILVHVMMCRCCRCRLLIYSFSLITKDRGSVTCRRMALCSISSTVYYKMMTNWKIYYILNLNHCARYTSSSRKLYVHFCKLTFYAVLFIIIIIFFFFLTIRHHIYIASLLWVHRNV